MSINNSRLVQNIKVMMLRGEKGPKGDKGDDGDYIANQYTSLGSKPQINGVTLAGNLSSADLGITYPVVLEKSANVSAHSMWGFQWTANELAAAGITDLSKWAVVSAEQMGGSGGIYRSAYAIYDGSSNPEVIPNTSRTVSGSQQTLFIRVINNTNLDMDVVGRVVLMKVAS